jgi:hypothetical protein
MLRWVEYRSMPDPKEAVSLLYSRYNGRQLYEMSKYVINSTRSAQYAESRCATEVSGFFTVTPNSWKRWITAYRCDAVIAKLV